MQSEDDTRSLAKIVSFLATVEVIVLLLHLYFTCNLSFVYLGLTHQKIEHILVKFSSESALFTWAMLEKLVVGCSVILRVWASRVVKDIDLKIPMVVGYALSGVILFFASGLLPRDSLGQQAFYASCVGIGYLLYIRGCHLVKRLLVLKLIKDVFNSYNESFMQNRTFLKNKYSVHFKTKFFYQGKSYRGWINVLNPFRATLVVGTPGSGKTYSIIHEFITQHLAKGFGMFIYDFKFDDLSLLAYKALHVCRTSFAHPVKFYVINFDQPSKSHRCNPIDRSYLDDISDAYEAAQTIFLNLNRTWVHKQGEFFVESPIVLFSAVIWYLRQYEQGRYCTLPHAIELLNVPYHDLFALLSSEPSLKNYLSSFTDALAAGAQEQLQGQLASAKIALSRLSSPVLYWIMSANDFTLDINNPLAPKVVCVANNAARQNIYSAVLSLYNARVVKVINKKEQLPCSVIIDELPTVYFKGLDQLINTARSNKIAVVLSMQDFSQLQRDYGDKESKVIQNTVGNIFSGQVLGETAAILQERFGRILQQKQSITISAEGNSNSISTNLDYLIPKAKISQLSQGVFVGSVSDDFNQPITQKIFHAQIDVSQTKSQQIQQLPISLPKVRDLGSSREESEQNRQLNEHFMQIKNQIATLVENQNAPRG